MNSHLKPIRLGGLFDKPNVRRQGGSIWDKYSICSALTTMDGGYR